MAAGRKIKGITIEIGGDTSGLEKALNGVNSKIKNTQSQLRDVNNLLKLDPTNTILVAQKQELLTDAIAETTKKLGTLEAAQKDVTAALEEGKIGQEQYMAFQREVEETKAVLGRYQQELSGLNTEQERLATNTSRLKKLFDATESSVDDYADVLGSRLVTAIKNGNANSDQLRIAITKVGKSATDGKADIKQLISALDSLDDGASIRNIIEEMKSAGNQADVTNEKLEGIGKTLTGDVMMDAVEQLSVIGDKITELGEKATDAYTEAENATVKASVYFGETGDAAEQTADIIKKIYADGVGDSIDDVSNAVITVKENLKDLDDVTLSNITKQGITLEKLYGIDMNETMRGVNALMVQYKMSAQKAMDYIVKGTQNGLDKTNELGDNLSEYSGKFEQAGYSAKEYFQLLQNGLEGGAYNLDKVHDAINEVTTRMVDGPLVDSINIFSSNTQAVFKAWKDGEATQKDVINSIVQDIASCTNQQEALNMAAVAFGTMAEDGNAKFITSLSTLGDTYTDVTGVAESMFNSSITETQKMDANMRSLQQSLEPVGEMLAKLANEILPPVVEIVQDIANSFSQLPESVQKTIITIGVLVAAFSALAPVITSLVTLFSTLGTAVLGPIALIIAAIGEFSLVFTNLWNSNEQFRIQMTELWEQIKTVVGSVIEEIKEIFESFMELVNVVWDAFGQDIVELVSARFETISKIISTVLTVIKGIIQTITGLIKGDWSTAWEGIKTVASGILDLIKTIISGAIENVKNIINLKLKVIKTIFSTIFDGIKSKVEEVLSNLITGIRNRVDKITTAVKDGFKVAIDYITSLPDKAVEWGRDFIEGLVDGITGAIGWVTDAVSGVAEKITSFLHFSVPDEGPLTKYETWMPDFMQGLAKGIEKSKHIVANAIAGVSKDMTIQANAMVEQSGVQQNNAILNIASILAQYLPYLAQGITLQWETGEVAATLAPAMNRELGVLAIEEGYR